MRYVYILLLMFFLIPSSYSEFYSGKEYNIFNLTVCYDDLMVKTFSNKTIDISFINCSFDRDFWYCPCKPNYQLWFIMNSDGPLEFDINMEYYIRDFSYIPSNNSIPSLYDAERDQYRRTKKINDIRILKKLKPKEVKKSLLNLESYNIIMVVLLVLILGVIFIIKSFIKYISSSESSENIDDVLNYQR